MAFPINAHRKFSPRSIMLEGAIYGTRLHLRVHLLEGHILTPDDKYLKCTTVSTVYQRCLLW